MRRIRPRTAGALCAVIFMISLPAPSFAAPGPAPDATEEVTPIGWLHLVCDHLFISWDWLSARLNQPAENQGPQMKGSGVPATRGGTSITPLNAPTTCDPATTEVGCAPDPDG